jgi:tricarballylate dehydrogenase
MSEGSKNIIVVGQGAAGLAAALAAAQEAHARGLPIRVTLLDKASADEAGGNTRWSPSNMRMASPDRVEPSFVHDMLTATQYQGDEAYFARIAHDAPATVKWIAAQGVEFIQPTYYLAKGPPRIQPVGGGPAVVKQLAAAAKAAGVALRNDCTVQSLESRHGCITGLILNHGGMQELLVADAVILACGGFEGDAATMREYFGEGAQTMRLISPGGKFNTGDGIRMALALGASRSGDWGGMHAEPVDARAKNSAPVVLVYPYGIVVDKNGRRFFDEGGGLVHETWEWFARHIQFKTPDSVAFAILDRRLLDIKDYERAIRSEVPPARADTIAGLAKMIGVDADNLAITIASYNAACTGDPNKFDASCCDRLSANNLVPPKSNWARAINEPPFLAYPLVGAVAYTFGGLATDASARVLREGSAIPGLYAAGEITGHFYATAPNAVSVLRAFVFGRIAGLEAVSFLQSRTY